MGEGQTIDLTGTPMGDEIMQALQAQGLMPQQGTPAEQTAPVSAGDRLEQLERLAKLRDAGALTDEELQAEKARLLGSG